MEDGKERWLAERGLRRIAVQKLSLVAPQRSDGGATPFLLHCASAESATVIDRRYRMNSTPVAPIPAASAAIPMEVKIKANQGKST
jgi:hypothetical protein